MEEETLCRFKKGDRVIVVDEESWCHGQHGTICSSYPIMKGSPIYSVRLDESPYPMLKTSWIYEDGLKKE